MRKGGPRRDGSHAPGDYGFCALYYIEGLSIEETARAIDRSERQCLRYKREIEGGAA